jgi:L-lysine 2,3-aminomutase
MSFFKNEILTYQKIKQLSFFAKEEISFIENNNFNLDRIAATAFYLNLAAEGKKQSPLRKQFVPSPEELKVLEYEKADP